MKKFGKFIVKHRVLIILVSLALLVPSAFGYLHTRINYDILSYLPGDIETMKGQDILLDEFGTGGFSMVVLEGMDHKDVADLKEKFEQVNCVNKVLWYDSLVDLSVPMDILPTKVKDAFNHEDSTLMLAIFNEGTSSDATMQAVQDMRAIAGKQCFISGISATVTDIKMLFLREMPIYVLIAVLASLLILGLSMDSFLIPVFFILSIGCAVLYNLGSNIMFGEISYITKALSAVLQLGVTMDYSIFLWHSYEEQQERFNGDKERAMVHAISNTITSVVGSSITTVAGFLALCFMSFTLGLDIGLVMAKGVVFGVLCCVTILPSLILIFDRAITKTKHKALLPEFGGIAGFVTKHYRIFLVLFLVVLFPAFYGQKNAPVYYDLTNTLPKNLESVAANEQLKEKFKLGVAHVALVDSSMDNKTVHELINEMDKVDGVKASLGLESVIGPAIPSEFIPEEVSSELKSDKYEMILITSEYGSGTDEVNEQCDKLSKIIKKYDKDGMLLGEAPCTKDLIEITNHDFAVVNIISIGVIFLIIAVIFKSISLPVILVSVIEFAIFINMGVPFYTNTSIPFISSIVIGTIQLGATVDYAILMTTRYRKERNLGNSKKEAVQITLSTSVKSVISSALSFFGATFGVGLYSDIDMISSLCTLMARGALISMVVVLTVLPAMFLIFDKVIVKTSLSFDTQAALGEKKNLKEA